MPRSQGLGDRPTERNGEAEEQGAFWRTHKARESSRSARVKAQRDRADKEKDGGKK